MKVEVFRCKTCGDIYAIARYPDCNNNLNWQKDKISQLKKGNTIFEILDYKENMLGGYNVNKCCGKKEKKQL